MSLAHGLVAVACAIWAYFPVFSSFARYDDEGYMLISLRSFRDGADLYEDLYGQYGPFFYEFWGGLAAITGVDLTMDNGRFVVVAVWALASLFCGLATYAVTRSLLLALPAQLVAFLSLRTIVAEPMHPGGLIVLLLAAMALVAALAGPERPAAVALLGALGAAIALIKINVGAIALIAALAAALATDGGRWARWPRVAVEVAMLCLPALLIRPDLGTRWGLSLAGLVTVGAGAVVLALRRWNPPVTRDPRRPAVPLVAGAAVAAVAILAVAIAAGATPGGLFEGIVTGPLGQRGAFTVPYPTPSFAETLFFILVLGGVGALALAARTRPSPLLGASAIVAGALTCASILPVVPERARLVLPVLLAWTATMAASTTGDERAAPYARAFIPLVAVLGVLHAYPVAGSQLKFAAPLFAVVGGMALSRGLTELTAWARERGMAFTPPRIAVIAGGAALALLAAAGLAFAVSRDRDDYRAGVAAALPGAERVRFKPEDARTFTLLADHVRRNCETLITLPGMNSLHLWSGVEPPTAMNATAWMYLFDSGRQRRIVSALKRAPRPCLVRHEGLIDFWGRGRELPSRPLVQYLDTAFVPQRTIGRYEVHVPR